jgi:glycosyltransferase involved in cell wall biosynthesis
VIRVLQVTPRYFPDSGGIETHVHNVASRLAASGVEVTVLATDRSHRLPRRELADGVVLRRVPAWPRGRDYYLAPGLWREIAQGGHDLVHFQGVHTLVPVLGMLACLRHRKPYVLTLHTGGHSSQLRSRLRAVQWRLLGPLLRRARRVIGVSRFEADLFAGLLGLDPQRLTVIRNGGTLPAAAPPEPSTRDGGSLIISVARLERYKGHHRLIEAMPRLLAARPDARALILGTGPYESSLRALADRLGVADRVDMAYVPPGDRDRLARTLRQAAVVVLFSEYEAHPVAVMEAIALDRPVLVTVNSGLAELVEEGLCQGVPSDATADDIAEALAQLLAAPDQPGHPPVRLPDWDQCAAELLGVYEAVLDGRVP